MSIKIYPDIIQGTDEWHELRLGSLGSSSVKNAMAGGQGKSRRTLACNLVAEQVTGEKTESFGGTAAMEEGQRREAESRDFHAFRSGIEWDEVGLITNTDFPGQHTSPDGINQELECGLELKNVQFNTMVGYLERGTMVTRYIPQCQHAMMITGWDVWHFMAYHPAFSSQLVITVARDQVYIDKMQEKLVVFFNEMRKIHGVVTGGVEEITEQKKSKLEILF